MHSANNLANPHRNALSQLLYKCLSLIKSEMNVRFSVLVSFTGLLELIFIGKFLKPKQFPPSILLNILSPLRI
jgi:hypothetical protein